MTNQQPEESSNLGDLEDFTYYMRGKVEALEMVMKSFLQVALGNDEARTYFAGNFQHLLTISDDVMARGFITPARLLEDAEYMRIGNAVSAGYQEALTGFIELLGNGFRQDNEKA